MTKVEIIKPSEQILADANAVEPLIVGSRRIGLKKPSILLQYRIVELVGPETAKNMVYMNMVNPLLWVVEIDGAPVLTPSTKRELEALITQLGDDGIAAVLERFAPKQSAADLKELADKFAQAAQEAGQVESEQGASLSDAVKN